MSAAAIGGAKLAVNVFFYINLVLLFVGFITITVLAVLYKKTVYMRPLAIAGFATFGASAVMFGVQLGMYAVGHVGAMYAVYVCFAVQYCLFAVSGVYCALLSRNSHRLLCLITGPLFIIPPIGASMAVLLSYRIQRDTPEKKFVFSGYAYTYAALCAVNERNAAEFVDLSGEEELEPLGDKEIKKKLKALKAASDTAEGRYNYAVAIMGYTPQKINKALKLMQKAADAGYTPAQYNIGYCYETGEHVKRDYKQARYYYTKAASGGDKDAALRIALIDIESGYADSGLRKLNEFAESGDLCAKYNLGVSYELGRGVLIDLEKAFGIYTECANSGMYIAQKRIFAAASADMQSAQNGRLFRMITDRHFESEEFTTVIDGLINIKKHLAADASRKFLEAVEKHGKWEGVARCLIGTLYIDCGKTDADKLNGAEYIRSAFTLWRGAKNIYAALPRWMTKPAK